MYKNGVHTFKLSNRVSVMYARDSLEKKNSIGYIIEFNHDSIWPILVDFGTWRAWYKPSELLNA